MNCVRRLKVLFFAMIGVSLALSSINSHAAVVDKVLVVVNDEVVTQREFDRLYIPIKKEYEASFEGEDLKEKLETVKKGLLEQMVSSKLVVSLAKQAKVQIDEEKFQSDMDKIKSYYASEDEFLQSLSAKGTNLTEFERELREQALAQKLVEKEVASKIVISPGETRDLYEKNKDKLLAPERVRVRGIMIRKRTGSEDDSRKKIDEVLKELNSGKDFASLAIERSEGPYASDGGDMGYIIAGNMLPEIDEAVFSLKEGGLSGVVETPIGYHIFLVEEIQKERPLKYEEVSDFLKEQIYMRKFSENLYKWIEEKRKNAYISYK